MKSRFFTLIALVLCLMPLSMSAQSIVATDTLALSVNSVVPEFYPSNQNYVFGIFGDAALPGQSTKSYKIQLNYNSANMYGTFSDSDFDLAGAGKNLNFIRTADGMSFWLFEHLDVEVRDSVGATVIDVNGLIKNFSQYRRILAKAVIPAPAPEDTIDVDLGVVAVVPNTFYSYLILEAGNDEYSLAFGISGTSSITNGTYYRAELLMPEFVLLPNDTIGIVDATLVVSDGEEGSQNLILALLGSDNILYRIAMHTGAIVVTDTVSVVCKTARMQNLSDMFGFYQISGFNDDYQVAVAFKPEAIEQSMRTFTSEQIDLSYTQVLRVSDSTLIRVQQAEGNIWVDSTTYLFPAVMVEANFVGTNGTLYQVTLPVGGSDLPLAVDTTVVECGNYVGRLDYTNGPGWLGLVIGNSDYDVHVTVYNGLSMSGAFSTDMFIYDDPMSYVTIYNDPNVDFLFSNIQAAEMRMDSINDTVRIELNVVTESEHMYCFRANLLPKYALTGEEITYALTTPGLDDGNFVGAVLDRELGNYQLQFQRAEGWNEEGWMIGDHEIWTFDITQNAIDGVSGKYGYSDGTMGDTTMHVIVEDSTEIWLMPMAGTLQVNVESELTIPAEFLGTKNDYKTHIYSIEARFVAENNKIYNLSGTNFLLCIDYATEQLVEFTESALSLLDQTLSPSGFRIHKVLRNGLILLESTHTSTHSSLPTHTSQPTHSTYTLQGNLVK